MALDGTEWREPVEDWAREIWKLGAGNSRVAFERSSAKRDGTRVFMEVAPISLHTPLSAEQLASMQKTCDEIKATIAKDAFSGDSPRMRQTKAKALVEKAIADESAKERRTRLEKYGYAMPGDTAEQIAARNRELMGQPPRYVVMRAGEAKAEARAFWCENEAGAYEWVVRLNSAGDDRVMVAGSIWEFGTTPLRGTWNQWCIVDMHSECYRGKREPTDADIVSVEPPCRSQLGPLDRVVDGMTVRGCLARYKRLQALDCSDDHVALRKTIALTPAQIAACSSEWSRQLRELVKQGEEEGRAREARQAGWNPDPDGDE